MSDYTGGAGVGCCSRCCGFIFTLGLAALFMWLSLRGSNPTISVEDFYVPALNLSANSRSNRSLYFDLKLNNGMKDKGVGYDDVNLTFYYGSNISLPVGNYTVPRFRQGHGKKTHRRQLVETRGVPWEAAYSAVSNGTKVVFRVGLATKVRYRILWWYTKRHNMMEGANVDVDGSGQKVHKKGIKLKSAAPKQRRYLAPVGLFIVLYFLDLFCISP